MEPLLEELKRRNVFRVGLAYAVVAWLILQVSGLVVPYLGLPPWTMPFLIFILAIGFPLVLLFAWAFELTPDGLKRSAEVTQTASTFPTTAKRLNQLTTGVLCLAVALLLVDRFVFTSKETPVPEPGVASDRTVDKSYASIAVLPFVNMSDEKQQEYFSDGISEELLNLLAKVRELRVAARTSSFAFKGKNMNIKEIARQLNVEAVLEGSVRLSGARLRITAQLIDAQTGYHLWSDTYDRELTDVFAIQDEISAAIVKALQVHLVGAGPARQAVTDVKAYDSFLRGRERIHTRDGDALYSSLLNFETAIQIDPDYAPAHAAKAEAYALLIDYSGFPADPATGLAGLSVERALSLNPDLADAHAVKGLLLSRQGEHEKALASLGRAIEIAPNMARAYNWEGNSHRDSGYPALAMQSYEKAHEIDPLFLPPISNLTSSHLLRGHEGQAQEYHEKYKAIVPEGLSRGSSADFFWEFYTGDFSSAYAMADKTNSRILLELAGLFLKKQELAYTDEFMRSLSPIVFRDVERLKMQYTEPGVTGSDAGKINLVYQHLIEPVEGSLARIFDLTKDMDRSFDGPLFGPVPQNTLATELIGLWRKAGKGEEAAALADQARAYVKEMEERGYELDLDRARAALLVFDADYDGAMEILERMARRHQLYWWYDSTPSLAKLHDRDDFQRLIDNHYKHLNAERAKLGWEPVTRTVLE